VSTVYLVTVGFVTFFRGQAEMPEATSTFVNSFTATTGIVRRSSSGRRSSSHAAAPRSRQTPPEGGRNDCAAANDAGFAKAALPRASARPSARVMALRSRRDGTKT
jgi:hypothetical protein